MTLHKTLHKTDTTEDLEHLNTFTPSHLQMTKNSMDQNIYSRIIQPLEMALQGQIPSAQLDWGRGSVPTYAWFVRDKQGRADELFEELLPYYEEFLFNPENRMFVAYDECTDASKSWQYNATLCLRSLLDKDIERWPRLFEHHDLFDFALKCADLESAGIADATFSTNMRVVLLPMGLNRIGMPCREKYCLN